MPPAATAARVEYKQLRLNIEHEPRIEFQRWKKAGHEKSEGEAKARADERVLREVGHLVSQGWTLDGPFDAAVQYQTKLGNTLWGGDVKGHYVSATVKLRRQI